MNQGKTKEGTNRKRSARKDEGRPTKYTKELGDKICCGIAEGKSLKKVAEEREIGMRTVFSWFRTIEEFQQNYQKAKEEQAELFAEEIIEIADQELPMCDGKIDAASVAQAKLRVDARKWTASKLKPKKYGERITTEEVGNKEPVHMSITLNTEE